MPCTVTDRKLKNLTPGTAFRRFTLYKSKIKKNRLRNLPPFYSRMWLYSQNDNCELYPHVPLYNHYQWTEKNVGHG